ncbi:hypothetical protein CSC74_03600 [Pseudoxanthomonas yeongjuensis]|nr:hypothetical protein CSC74_03600 [Pseudoxanthomonas yeongjuensis]
MAVYAFAILASAQDGKPVVPATPPAASENFAGADALADALTCRIGNDRYPGLMEEIRNERPQDFRQTYRQYSAPMMDVYHLEDPVQAWGNESDTIVIGPNRVMVAIKGSLDAVTAQLEHSLEQSSQSPLSGALDDKHALVIFEAEQPGLEGMVLLGCEYRNPGISLLDDPADAWKKKPEGNPPSPPQSRTVPSNP